MKDTTCSEFSLENEVLRRIFGQKRGNISAISLRLFEMFASAISLQSPAILLRPVPDHCGKENNPVLLQL